MTEGRNPDGILRAAAQAEALRRRRLVTRQLVRVVPLVSGGLVVVAALVRFARVPALAFWIAAGVAAVALAVFAWISGRVPPVTDAAAARLDADANLAGELRSAHWFVAESARDAWTSFHLERAERTVERVDWPAVYPPVTAARAWAASTLMTLVALTLVVTAAWPAATTTVPAGAPVTVARTTEPAIPADLQKQIDDLLRAVQSGAMPMDVARAKVSELREALAGLDPKAQAALAKAAADVNAKNADGKSATNPTDPDAAALADRAEKAASKPFLPQDMKWSMEDLAQKLKYAGRPADKQQGEGAGDQNHQPSDQKSPDAEKGQDAGVAMTRSAAADAASSQMLASTASPMGSERGLNGAVEKKGRATDPLDLTGALHKETVQADADSQGENVLAEMRRKSERSHSTLSFSHVAPLATYDKSRAVAPPPTPDALRPLLKQYFIRR